MEKNAINSIEEYLEIPAGNRGDALPVKPSSQFAKDIYLKLEAEDPDLTRTAMILASHFKLIGAVPELYNLIDSNKIINPFGNLDPVSIIIDFGPDAFNILMDCMARSSTQNKISTVSKIIFHWWLNEPGKMNDLINQRTKNMGAEEETVIESARAQLETYKNAKNT